MTPARGDGLPFSPALCTAFCKVLSNWSHGAYSPRLARPMSLCAASRSGSYRSWFTADPPSSLPPAGLSSLLDGVFLSSLLPAGFLLLLLILFHAQLSYHTSHDTESSRYSTVILLRYYSNNLTPVIIIVLIPSAR